MPEAVVMFVAVDAGVRGVVQDGQVLSTVMYPEIVVAPTVRGEPFDSST